jgi:fructokinase
MSETRRPVLFGEVLHDCFPDGSRVLGGAPLNVAWHLRALGLDPYLVSRIGHDDAGREVLEALRKGSLDIAGMQIDPGRPTGRVTVHIDACEPRFQIPPDQPWDRIAAPPDPPPDTGLLYHGTLALRDPRSGRSLAALRSAVAAPVFVDVNLRDPWWNAARVADALDGARWCKLNDDELRRLSGPGDLRDAALRLVARHGLERAFVTRGAAGAFALGADGDCHPVTPLPGIVVIDTVGAGDAFAAGVIAGLLGHWGIETTLRRATRLASGVCGLRGAVAASPAFYEQLFARWDFD